VGGALRRPQFGLSFHFFPNEFGASPLATRISLADTPSTCGGVVHFICLMGITS